MTAQQIAQRLQEKFGSRILQALTDDKHPRVHIDAKDALELARFCRDDEQLQLDWLQCLSGVDYVADGKMCVVYDLWSFGQRHGIAVKAYCPREE